MGPASLKGRFQALALLGEEQLWGERNFILEE